MESSLFSEDEVRTALKRIDPHKSCGPDRIPGRLLLKGADQVAKPLSDIYNLSLATGTLYIPVDWKSSNITAIFKNRSKHSPSNYRPISLTSVAMKVLERLIHQRITQFLLDHNKLSPSEHGFRPNHSCQTQLLECVHQWSEALNQHSSSHVVFLDFARASDSVPHQRLLLKLDNIGIRGPVLNWIEAFLRGRQQRVVVEGHHSTWSPVTSGVPQGSILGPLIFLIFINDIGDDLTSTTKLFADDCALYRQIKSSNDTKILQNDVNRLHSWSQKWHLPLNTSKCKVMNITNKNKINTTRTRTPSTTPPWNGLTPSSTSA